MTIRHFSCVVLLLALATLVAAHTSKDCIYTMYIRTGDKEKAGTDSKIGVILADSDGQKITIPNLEKWGQMGKDYDYYERGNLDIFSGKGACVRPPICRLKLSSDIKGYSPGWYVEYAEVTIARPHATCARTVFDVNNWVGVDGPDLNIVLEECKNYVSKPEEESNFMNVVETAA